MQLFAGWLSLCQAPSELSASFGEPGRNSTVKGSMLLWVTQPDLWGPAPDLHCTSERRSGSASLPNQVGPSLSKEQQERTAAPDVFSKTHRSLGGVWARGSPGSQEMLLASGEMWVPAGGTGMQPSRGFTPTSHWACLSVRPGSRLGCAEHRSRTGWRGAEMKGEALCLTGSALSHRSGTMAKLWGHLFWYFSSSS